MGSQKSWTKQQKTIIHTTYIWRGKSVVLCILDIICYQIIYTIYIYTYFKRKTLCIACYHLWFLKIHTYIFLPANAEDLRDTGSIPGSGRSPGGGNGNPLLYSGLENPTDREAWWTTAHGVTKSWTRLKWLSTVFLLHRIFPGRRTQYTVKWLPLVLCPFLVFQFGLLFNHVCVNYLFNNKTNNTTYSKERERERERERDALQGSLPP